MKTPSTELHQLIHSLSKAEKRHFKLHASRVKRNGNMVRLFDAIEAQREYDEDKIREQFKGEVFLKQLTSTKHYLTKSILRSLHVQHLNVPYARLREQLHQIEILIDKGLHSIAKKLLEKTKKAALHYEFYTLLVDMRPLEVRLIERSADGEQVATIPQVFKNSRFYLAQLEKESIYQQHFVQASLSSYIKGSTRSASDFGTIEESMEHPVVSDENLATSYRGKLFCYSFYGIYYRGKQELESSYNYRKRIKELMEEHPHQLSQTPFDYIIACFNLAALCSELWLYHEVFEITKQMREFIASPALAQKPGLQEAGLEYVIRLEIYAYPRLGRFQEGVNAAEEAFALIRTRGQKMHSNNAALLYFNLAYNFYGSGDSKKALYWLHQLHREYPGSREDIRGYARILELIIHFERDDPDFLPYAVRSTYRYLLRRDRVYQMEESLLRFFRKKVVHLHTRAQIREALQSLYEELNGVFADVFERKALHNFDFLSWLESQIHDRSFAEVTAANYRQHVIGT